MTLLTYWKARTCRPAQTDAGDNQRASKLPSQITRDHQLVAAVKKTVNDLAKDAQVVTDQIKAVYVENDRSKLAECTNAIQNMISHQETLTNLCNVGK